MEHSIFMDKSKPPADKALREVLGDKSDLIGAKVYAEGRGVRIPVPDSSALKDIFSLIDFKLAF